jgi:ABC-type uncharacterized transport system involved in gliding motility auxiliary subunit
MASGELDRAKTGANAVLFVVMVIGALIAANLIGTRLFKRIDFTEDKVYTLSAASKDLVKKLPDRMTVKAYISKDLQPPFSNISQYVRDLLDEYAAASGGKLKWEAIDPAGDKSLEEEAQKNRVSKVARASGSTGKVQIGNSYLGVSFQYQGNIESIPEINGVEGLEFQMTSLIKMLSVKKKKIVFAASEGELPLQGGGPEGAHGGLSALKQYMADYQVESQPINQKLLADDVDALVIAGPTQAVSERAKFVIDQFLMKGKAVLFLVDGMVVQQVGGVAQVNQPTLGRKNDHGLDDLLEHYGFKVRDDIVMEPKLNVPGPVMVRGQLMLANYPTFTAAVRLSSTHPITERLKGVIFPMASSVELVSGKQPGLEVTALATSSNEAWRQAGIFVMDPETPIKPGPDRGPFTYAYAAKGNLTSFFAGKPHPNEKGEKVDPPAPNVSAPPGEEAVLDASKAAPRLVVVGDSGFASDEYLRIARYVQSYSADVIFAMSILDWLVQDETLAALRQKSVQSRPLRVESEAAPRLAKYGNLVGISLAFILFGVGRARLRKRWRDSFKI